MDWFCFVIYEELPLVLLQIELVARCFIGHNDLIVHESENLMRLLEDFA